jgi:hypothetical protein
VEKFTCSVESKKFLLGKFRELSGLDVGPERFEDCKSGNACLSEDSSNCSFRTGGFVGGSRESGKLAAEFCNRSCPSSPVGLLGYSLDNLILEGSSEKTVFLKIESVNNI